MQNWRNRKRKIECRRSGRVEIWKMKTFYDRKSVRIKSVDQANLIWSLSSEKQFSFPFKKDRENLLFFEYSKICQCRIQDFPEGAPTPRGGTPTYYFFNRCQILHENERIWTEREGAYPWRPLESPLRYEIHEFLVAYIFIKTTFCVMDILHFPFLHYLCHNRHRLPHGIGLRKTGREKPEVQEPEQ